MRMTKQKTTILDIINNSYAHLDALGVYKEAKEIIPNISLATVYRNLNLLVEEGKIVRIKKGLVDRYDAKRERHDHFFCNKCGKIIDIYEEIVIPDDVYKVGRILEYEINFTGICRDCMKEKERDNNGIKRK